ncbi:MAG: outer membrane beta-barrel protein [Bacteroidales bacterium]|nr:outer membrane beta-barrel protein [Bacteroidales bacterium]
MKKLFITLFMAAIPLLAFAQTEAQTNENLEVYVLGGLNMHSITGEDYNAADNRGFGYNIVFGYQKPLGQNENLFYGYEVGMGTRGSWTVKDGVDSKMVDHAIQIGINLIYRIRISDKETLDFHVGEATTMDMFGKTVATAKVGGETYTSESKLKDYGTGFRMSDITLVPGVTFWYGKFGVDISWQRGLIPMSVDTDICQSNLLFRLGYKF